MLSVKGIKGHTVVPLLSSETKNFRHRSFQFRLTLLEREKKNRLLPRTPGRSVSFDILPLWIGCGSHGSAAPQSEPPHMCADSAIQARLFQWASVLQLYFFNSDD